ncbi:G-protein coupled receptor 35-like [Mytilus trossulus]|uniref:G-protein coupled receptor 35-like n=1 Tax=Mytilus trossulus TaxID=6551 RepID=UPI003007C515
MKNATLFENSMSRDLSNISEIARPITTEILLRFEPYSVYIDRIVSPIWYSIGLFGNPISAKVWLGRKSRKNSSAIYLGLLAIVHMFQLIIHFVFAELTYTWDIPTNNRPVLCETFNVLSIFPQYLAPLLVLGFTVERYIAVCHPFRKEQWCTVRRAFIVIACLTALSIIFACVQADLWTYYPIYKECFSKDGNQKFQIIWTASTEIMFFLVVPLCVLMFNILVIREIKRITSHGPAVSAGESHTSTVTLLSVSFYFICTLLPASVVYAIQYEMPTGKMENLLTLEWIATDPVWLSFFKYIAIRKVVEEVCLSNSACYFFIYYITGKNFRTQVHSLFTY